MYRGPPLKPKEIVFFAIVALFGMLIVVPLLAEASETVMNLLFVILVVGMRAFIVVMTWLVIKARR